MKLRLLVLLLLSCLGLLACANKPPVPDWEMNAHGALGSATQAYLVGNSRVADAEFARARQELASTGRFDLVARAELARCAAHRASLDLQACVAYDALAGDAAAPERAYAQFLTGQWNGLNATLLPEQYRSALAANDTSAWLASVNSPLSRLIAAAALLQSERLTPSGIALAVETASAQGWRRPLLAWLGVQAQRARASGDTQAWAQIQRRMALVGAAP